MKKELFALKFLLISLLFSTVLSFSQTNWAFHAPGIGGDAPTSPLVFNCIDRDVLGNIIVSSTTVDSIQFGPFAIAGYQVVPPSPIYTENAYFSKMTASGECLWLNMVNASVYSRIYDLKTDKSNNIYILGNLIGNATFDTVSVTDVEEMFLAKYAPDGSLEWVTFTETPPTTNDPPQGRALAIGNDGHVYISGWMTEVVNFQNIVLDVGPSYNFFIARYTDEGVADWARGYGLFYPLNTNVGLDLDAGNNIYLSSTTVDVSMFDTIQVSAEVEAYFLAKFNDEGDIAWIDLVHNRSVTSTRLAVDRQSNQIYVTGYYGQDDVQFGDYTLNLAVFAGKTMFLTKYDANKQVLWAKPNFGDIRLTRAKAIDVSPDGSAFLSGDYGQDSQTGIGVIFGEGDNAVTLKQRGTYDGFMVKYKANGTVDWATPFAGLEHDDAKAVCAYSNEIGVVTGILVNNIYIGDTTFFSSPRDFSGNFYLASTDGTAGPSGIFDFSKVPAEFQVYPNPANDLIMLKLDNANIQSVVISFYTLTGKEVKRLERDTNNITVSMTDMNPGLYLINVLDENGESLGSGRLIVQ